MNMNSMKEAAIRDYMSNIDFKDDSWGLARIKEDMRKFLGEEPGIDIIYRNDSIVNEILGEAHEIKVLDKVQVVFYDIDEKFKKLEFIIGDIK